jgi:hypothetical protein
MARKPEDIDPNEIKTSQYHDFLILALYQLGGSARKEPVIERVGEMLKDQFKPCDWRRLYKGPHGIDVAPEGYTGTTFPVWENKVSLAHRWLIDKDLALARGGVQTLNAKGLEYVVQLQEEKEDE